MHLEWHPLEEPVTILSVEKDKKNKHHYFVYGQHSQDPLFSVHEDILIQFRLLKGQIITPADAAGIIEANEKHKAYTLAIGYLGRKPRTRKEIERYLLRKELPQEIIESVNDRLIKEKLVNDTEYAHQFADQRLRGQFKGRRWIKQELAQRGIDRDAAAEAIEALDPAMELESAIKAGSKKWPSLKGEFREKKQRLSLFLMRRGFPNSVIREAVKEIAVSSDDGDSGDWLDN